MSFFTLRVFFFFSAFLVLSLLFQRPSLEAGGWGKTENIKIYEGIIWNEVYFDMDDLYYTAYIPNYLGVLIEVDGVTMSGKVQGGGYIISTSPNEEFSFTEEDLTATELKILIQDLFQETLEENNPNYVVTAIDAKKLGALWAFDMIPTNPEDGWLRIVVASDRLIKMVTKDTNANRRLHFFESIYIH